MVVEDDGDQRHLVRSVLEQEGWQVIEAWNGAVALQLLEETTVELILLDLLMPEMDGFEFVAALKQRPEWHKIPVIVITSKDVTNEDRLRLSGQVQRILSKGGLDGPSLLSEVRQVIATRVKGVAQKG